MGEDAAQSTRAKRRLALPIAVIIVCALCRPAAAGPPFATDDPEPVEFGHFEINIAATGSFIKAGQAGAAPTIDANYGVVEDVQLHLGIADDFDNQGVRSTRVGYGDTELGIKYRFIEEDEDGWVPQVAIYPNVEIPTGSVTKQFGTGEVRAYLPIWVQKSIGEWTSYGGGGYWINPPNGVTSEKNYWFAGWTLLRQIDENWSLGGEIFWQSPNGEEIATGAGFNLGGTYNINETYHILFSAGRNLEDPTRFNAASFYLGLQLFL
jgi:hypothetical protein